MKKVRIEVDGVLYESVEIDKIAHISDNVCEKCQLPDACGICPQEQIFRRADYTIDDLLQQNKDVLQRMKMGIPPHAVNDDSEYIND